MAGIINGMMGTDHHWRVTLMVMFTLLIIGSSGAGLLGWQAANTHYQMIEGIQRTENAIRLAAVVNIVPFEDRAKILPLVIEGLDPFMAARVRQRLGIRPVEPGDERPARGGVRQ